MDKNSVERTSAATSQDFLQLTSQGLFADIEPDNQLLSLSWFPFTDAEDHNRGEQYWYTAQGNYASAQAELVVYETLGGKFEDPKR